MLKIILGFAAALAVCGAAAAQPAPTSAQIGARPPGDVARDPLRHPAAVLAFAGVRPGDTVVELIPGGGYYTRLLSAAVGPNGKVFAIIPPYLAEHSPKAVDGERALAAEPGYANVAVVVEALSAITDQGPADLVFTAENYHDLHNSHVPPTTASDLDKAVYAALKPGGVFLIDDHVGAPGTADTQASTLHRIEPAFVRVEVESSGLRFDGSSPVVANPNDPHTAAVFDPSIRGRTDQFVFRFKKPG